MKWYIQNASIVLAVGHQLVAKQERTDVVTQEDPLSEPVFRQAADCAPDGLAIVDQQGSILYANHALENLCSCTREALQNCSLPELFAQPELLKSALCNALEEGKWHGEATGLRKDNSAFPAGVSITRLTQSCDRENVLLVVIRDLTDEKAWQSRLELRTKQLSALLEASREINSVLATQDVMRLLVQHAMDLTSASGGCAGLLVDDIMVFRECNIEGQVIPIDYAFPRGCGVAGWVIEHRQPYITNDVEHDPLVEPKMYREMGFSKLINVPIIASDGRILGCFELHNRAHERSFTEEDAEVLVGLANQAAVALTNAALAESLRESAETIKRNEETLRLLVEGTPDFFFYIHDANGVFTYVSPSVELITGYTPAEWMTHYTKYLTDNPINEKVVYYTERTLKTGTGVGSYPVEIYHKNGSRIMLEVYEQPIIENGKVVGVRGVARDVTELCRAEIAERAARQEAENRIRSFYKETIFAVTDGKLEIMEREEIERMCIGPDLPEMEIRDARDVAKARKMVKEAAQAAGMESGQIDALILCVGEAATNAYKHGGGGKLTMCHKGDSIRVKISDSGPGMDSLALPKIAFMKGFSTVKSLGMGYANILACADKVYLSTGPEGTTVVIEVFKQPKPLEMQLASLPDLW
ncbi:MAG: PAS domain S-box protein [Armatimonadota bacterium]|nr:PAS domain S-box protein [Armatimonadota bacterium]